MRVLIIFSFLLTLSCARPQIELPEYNMVLTDKERDIQNQMFADSWLDTYIPFSVMGTDILFNAVELCDEDDRIYSLGMNLGNENSAFEIIRDEINQSLGLGPKLKVVSIGLVSPAAKAGVLAGDELLEINGEKIKQGEDAFSFYTEKIDREFSKLYDLKILRNAKIIDYQVRSEQRCRFDFVIDLDNNTFNAFANGDIMVFSLRMAKWLLMNETGAAIVFAHELGHNANKHVADKKQNAQAGALLGLLLGIYVGLPQDMMEIGQSVGASAYSIDYENEADYLSMYILQKAGYSLDDAVDFWRSFAVEVPNSIYSQGGTHPSTAERYVRMEATIKEIKNKIENNEPLIPSYEKVN